MADTGGSSSGDDWCTIESDPGVFTELLEKLGCKGIELEELWSLDDDSLQRLGESTGCVYGLIFLFKWLGNDHGSGAGGRPGGGGEEKGDGGDAQTPTGRRGPLGEDEIPSDLFFAHQVTTNACATQAILSIVLNRRDELSGEELGPVLSEFQSFTASFPPSLKGMAISSSEPIKTVHNSFGRQDAFLQEGKIHIPTGDEEAFHFVAYVPVSDTVYELDGLQRGPIVVGTVGGENEGGTAAANPQKDWLHVARSAIQERMVAGGDHVKFNLMAIIQDKRIQLKEKLERLTGEGEGDSKNSPKEEEKQMEYSELMASLAAEDAKREGWKLENQRRRHNYVPLCLQMLSELARMGKLPQLIKDAKEKQAEMQKQRQKQKPQKE